MATKNKKTPAKTGKLKASPAIPTVYTYTEDLGQDMLVSIAASIGITPTSVAAQPVLTVAVSMPDALGPSDKLNLDTFMLDQGYKFTGQVP